MKIVIEIPQETRQMIRAMADDGRDIAGAFSQGLADAGQMAASHVQTNYLSGQYLKVRSGDLREQIQSWMVSQYEMVIGVNPDAVGAGNVKRYKWLLGEGQETITPRNGKFLAIPIGFALAPSGRIKDEYNVGLRNIDGGFFVRKNGQLLFGIRLGKTERSKFRPLFVLKTSVTVFATGALYDGVMEKLDDMTDAIDKRVQAALAKN